MTGQSFIQKLNTATGKMEWICVAKDDDLRHEIAQSTYAGMLHDKERNEKYFEALREAVASMKKLSSEIHALDIGTGSGILAMMASRAGACDVTACEVFQPMAFIAQKVIQRNCLQNKIKIVNKRSTEIQIPQDMSTKADILVTEIFDTELIGEGVLPTLRDAHERLLTSNAKVIPSSASVYIQLIESEKLWKMNKLKYDNFDFDFPSKFRKCAGTANPHEIQINQLHPDNINLLTQYKMIKIFDFTKPYYHEGASKTSMSTDLLHIDVCGTVHAVLFWWDLNMLEDRYIKLSMHPKWVQESEVDNENLKRNDSKTVWRDHWMQAVYYLHQPFQVKQQEKVSVTMFHDDYSVWFDVSNVKKQKSYVDRPLCSCRLHIMWPRERFAQLNSEHYLKYLHEIMAVVRDRDSSVLVVGSNSLLPLMISDKSGVAYLEQSEFSLPFVDTIIAYNKMKNVKVITNENDISNTKFDVILAEPYFSSSLLPWHHLQIWKLFAKYKELNGNGATFYPLKAVLKACVVSFNDLWKVQAPIKNILGFDLGVFDDMIKSAMQPIDFKGYGFFDPVEPYSVWEFVVKNLSKPKTICEFYFNSEPYDEIQQFMGEIRDISEYFSSNGVVLWMDFMISDNIFWSTGLNLENQWVNYSKQGVFFLKKRLEKDFLSYNIFFLPNENEFIFSFL